MINVGELPTVTKSGQLTQGWENLGLPESVVNLTAHIVDGGEPHRCHCCNTLVKTYVRKPGSPHAWCLRCW